ncbi:MAG: pseudouridine synthase [Gammaproteobacteria bacterium]|nr:pseudouridine synthase [Gammaproteobacteria bacterium]
MSISKYSSKLSLPQINPGVATVLEYLVARFPDIDADAWRQRMTEGRVHWHDGTVITASTAYQAQQRVYYYREVDSEPVIPFAEEILFQNAHILVAYKPHFLAVTPGGIWVNECLQNRLRRKTGLDDLQAMHRLDRATAGLVLFSINPQTRQHYHDLFKTRQIHKTYHAIAAVKAAENLTGGEWHIKNRMERSPIRFRMQIVAGVANSYSVIRCLEHRSDKALFELNPITGKTHQLRVHMQAQGWPVMHDKYYPVLQEKSADDFERPLQLVATGLRFVDPLSRELQVFSSAVGLVINGVRVKIQ